MENKFEVKSFINAEEMSRDVTIDITELDNMMIRHPSLYIHYAQQTVKAKKQLDSFKNAMEILEAQLDKRIRENFIKSGVKFTEAMVKSLIIVDGKHQALQKRILDAQEVYKLCEVAENAFSQRKDMILEIARDRRKEREGAMRVMDSDSLKAKVADMLSSK